MQCSAAIVLGARCSRTSPAKSTRCLLVAAMRQHWRDDDDNDGTVAARERAANAFAAFVKLRKAIGALNSIKMRP